MRMKKIILRFITATLILVIYNTVSAQKLISVKGLHGWYYKTISDIEKQQKPMVDFYRFTTHDTIGSIGAQACNWEAAYAAVSDSLFFYLQDIDSNYCNPAQAAKAWQYYGNLKGGPLNSGYTTVIGDEKTSHLPPASCNKILIINSFHEFTYPAEMLADIATKLKRGGILYIDEALATYSGELHPSCKKRMFLTDELLQLLNDNGFSYQNGVVLAYRHQKSARKLFAFVKK